LKFLLTPVTISIYSSSRLSNSQRRTAFSSSRWWLLVRRMAASQVAN